MKKHKIVAIVGTLVMTSNFLFPGLVFGQANQQGDLNIGCSGASPTFSEVPAATFDFSTNGLGGTITSSNAVVSTYSNPTGDLFWVRRSLH